MMGPFARFLICFMIVLGFAAFAITALLTNRASVLDFGYFMMASAGLSAVVAIAIGWRPGANE